MPAQLRPRRSQRNRKAPIKVTNSLVPSWSYADPVITMTFAQPFVLKGVPKFQLNTGELPASAQATSPTTVTLTYATGGVITDITVPERDPALRSSTGGYVAPGTFPVS